MFVQLNLVTQYLNKYLSTYIKTICWKSNLLVMDSKYLMWSDVGNTPPMSTFLLLMIKWNKRITNETVLFYYIWNELIPDFILSINHHQVYTRAEGGILLCQQTSTVKLWIDREKWLKCYCMNEQTILKRTKTYWIVNGTHYIFRLYTE